MAESEARIVKIDDPDALPVAAAALQAGRPIVLPTETVYGLAALPAVAGATAALFALKDRPGDVPLAVLVASAAQVDAIAGPMTVAAQRLAARWWPGPLTLVLRRRPGFDADLGGAATDTVGVRCPDHAFVLALAEMTGPIAATSANRHGAPTPPTAVEAAAALAGPVAVVVDGGRCAGRPSTVVDCTGDEVRIVREGALAAEDVVAVADGRSVR